MTCPSEVALYSLGVSYMLEMLVFFRMPWLVRVDLYYLTYLETN